MTKEAKNKIKAALIAVGILLLIVAAHLPARAQDGHLTGPFDPQYSNQIGPVSLPPYFHLSELMYGGNVAIGSMPDGNLIYRSPDGSLHICFFTTNTNVPYLAQSNPDPSADPTPYPEESSASPTPPPGSAGPGLRGELLRLVETARGLVPTIRRMIEKPMMPLLMRIAWILASFILALSLLRILRENNGASVEFYYWIGRAIFFLFLIGISPFIVFYLSKAGNSLTIPLNNTTDELQSSFDEKYREFMEGHFTIKDGNQIWVEPMKDGSPGLIGILYDKDKKIKDPSEAFDISSWEMPKLFALLSFTRALMEFADLFLIIGGAFIIIALRMAAPGMTALGIDQKLAHQTTYPYAWTLAAFTLVYPMVREIIRILGYLMGNLALAAYDGRAMYWMDERTGEIVTQAGYEPTLTIFIAAFIMLVTALAMCLAPFIAYKYLKGQIFEAVSSVTAGWMASIIGSGVELYGLRAGAAIMQQAGTVSAEGQFRSEQTRAIGQKEAADLSARSRQIAGIAGVQSNYMTTVGAIKSGQTTQLMLAGVQNAFGKQSTAAGIKLNQSDIEARRSQSVEQTGIQKTRDLFTNEGTYQSDRKTTAASMFGPQIGYKTNITAAKIRKDTSDFGSINYSGSTVANENRMAGGLTQNQEQYGQAMNEAYDSQLSGSTSAINAGASIALGAAASGRNTAMGGINQAYKLDLQANRSIYDSTIQGAQINRDAQLEAVKLNALNHVVTMFFRDVSRKVESGLTPRY